jgi:hypothetical protein
LLLFGATFAFAEIPSLPTTPAPIKELVFARPFILQDGFQFDWRQEQPVVKKGFLLVLEVNPDLVYPRQTAEPVLFVGDQTAMRLNVGYISGRVIAVAPYTQDLASIWFGTPQLPEAVTAEIISQERVLAKNNGLHPLSSDDVDIALNRGGTSLQLPDFKALLEEAEGLINQYAPDESE